MIKSQSKLFAVLLTVTIVASVFIGESMAGKGNKGEDIM